MERKFFKMLAVAAILALSGCSSDPADNGKSARVYEQSGMEVSKIVSQMADTLYQTMMADLVDIEIANGNVKRDGTLKSDPVIPKVAVTSFVDTDTYEDAGYLGRSMAEMFIHELDRRGIRVFEYKLTGSISITKDGEFVFSRNWKKVARQAMVRHILAGTITRNQHGLVIVGRIINMSNSTVVGSATGFISYDHLPYCYRTAQKNCSINGVTSYRDPKDQRVYSGGGKVTYTNGVRDTVTNVTYGPAATGKNEELTQRQKNEIFRNNYYRTDTNDFNNKYYVRGSKVPGTSTGNYEQYMYEKENALYRGSARSPVIYPAHTYDYRDRLVRDIHDASPYARVKD